MALKFGGTSSDYVRGQPHPVASPPLSMFCWAKFNSSASDMNLMQIGSEDATNSRTQFLIEYDVAPTPQIECTGLYDAGTRRTAAVSLATAGISDGKWFNVCCVHRATNDRSAWVNGTEATGGGTIFDYGNDDSIFFGILRHGGSGTFTEPFDGWLDHMAVWNTGLTAHDVSMLNGGANPLMVRPDKLVGYYITDGAGNLIDIVGRATITKYGSVTEADGPPNVARPTRKMLSIAIAAGAGSTVSPWGQQFLDRQFSAIAAARLNGVLQ